MSANCRTEFLIRVEFIAIGGQEIVVDLPSGEESEIAVKRSLFDALCYKARGELGATFTSNDGQRAVEAR
jgi:hypothetical protein